jgi:hypothetical protein
LRGTLAEILVVDSILGRERILAVNQLNVDPDGNPTVEIDLITENYIVEVSAGTLLNKEHQFEYLAKEAVAQQKRLILYYDPGRINRRVNTNKNLSKLIRIVRKHGIDLILRKFSWHNEVFTCDDLQLTAQEALRLSVFEDPAGF